jgi:hypothetical protein
MKKAFLTGVALAAMTMVAQADALDDRINDQVQEQSNAMRYQSTAACLKARDFQKTVDRMIQTAAIFKPYRLPEEKLRMAEIRDWQSKVDAWQAECDKAMGR